MSTTVGRTIALAPADRGIVAGDSHFRAHTAAAPAISGFSFPPSIRADERVRVVVVGVEESVVEIVDQRLARAEREPLEAGRQPGEQLGIDPDEVGVLGCQQLAQAAAVSGGDCGSGVAAPAASART